MIYIPLFEEFIFESNDNAFDPSKITKETDFSKLPKILKKLGFQPGGTDLLEVQVNNFISYLNKNENCYVGADLAIERTCHLAQEVSMRNAVIRASRAANNNQNTNINPYAPIGSKITAYKEDNGKIYYLTIIATK